MRRVYRDDEVKTRTFSTGIARSWFVVHHFWMMASDVGNEPREHGAKRLPLCAFAIVVAGLLVGTVGLLHGRVWDFRQAVISNILSSTDNPGGFLIGSIAVVLGSALLVPSVISLRKIYKLQQKILAEVGAALLGCSLLMAMILGVTSPKADDGSAFHIYLAYATFVASAGGLSVFLLLVALLKRNRSAWLAVTFQIVMFLFLLWLLYTQITNGYVLFDDSTAWRSLATCEWGLVGCTCGMWLWLTCNLCDSKRDGKQERQR
jgi:hypothetical protein